MQQQNRRGRPPSQSSQEVCEKLLRAAEECARDKPIRDIAAKEIAARAKVTQAMINYYFNNKEGLYIALIEFLISDWERNINELIAAMPQLDRAPTQQLVSVIDQCFYRRASVLKILIRELTQGDSGIREAYWDRLTTRLSSGWHNYLAMAIKCGFHRDGLDSRHALLAVLGVAMHPLSLDPEVLTEVYGMSLDELSSPTWLAFVEDNIDRLFGKG